VDSSERLSRHRCVVEHSIVWSLAFRRLAVGQNRHAITVTAVATVVITVFCARRLFREEA
jgi:hypothetical protein